MTNGYSADINSHAVDLPLVGAAAGQAMKNRIASRLFEIESKPALIGRFEVVESIGAGGMGVVYRARDPTLNREVALKLLHPRMLGNSTERARLLREALALAQLSHPNVVQLYEVGEHEDGVFLAMEYVSGLTLRRWQASAEHGWRALVAVYVQAGQGLAAAHAADLVHRDFKPDNCIIDALGRVRVLDFGLVREGTDRQTTSPTRGGEPSSSRSGRTPILPLTSVDTILGTLAYMPPEQLAGRPVDAKADQFSFCVALYEALYGERPYAGETLDGLSATYARGERLPPLEGGRVPSRVRGVLLRGLSLAPQDRWPSMLTLLGELERVIAPSDRRLLMGGLVGVVAIGVLSMRVQEGAPCLESRAQLGRAWDDERRAAVEASLLGTGLPYAAGVWARMEPALDDYADAWAAQHRDACEATRVREEQSAEVMDLRMGCLSGMKIELAAATGVLASADEDVLSHAHEVVGALRSPARCEDLEALRAGVEPPLPDEVSTVETIRELLAKARAERETGRYAVAYDAVGAARTRVAELDYEPVHMEVALEEGLVLETLGRYSDAEVALRQALGLASRWHQWNEMHQAGNALMLVIGDRQKRGEEALQYLEVALEVTGRDPLARAESLHAVASIFVVLGKYDEAEAEIRRALALQEESLGSEDLRVAKSLEVLGAVLLATGKYNESQVENRRAIAIAEKTLGTEHPLLAIPQMGIAGALYYQGMFDEAAETMRRVLELLERAHTPDHPKVAKAHSNLANVLEGQGKVEEAEAEYRRAVVLQEQRLGPKHPDVALSRNNLGVLLEKQSRYEEAEVEYRQALAMREEVMGTNHPLVASTRYSLAGVLLAIGRFEEAAALAELAWARNQRDDIPTEDRASTAFLLASTLWTDPAQRGRAHALARQADAIYTEAGMEADELTDIRTWLAKHPAPPL